MKFPYRKSIRLKAYDYSHPGAYFVTIVTHNRKPLFGKIQEDEMLLNALGQSIANVWVWLAMRHPYVELDEYVVMPSHLLGIVPSSTTEFFQAETLCSVSSKVARNLLRVRCYSTLSTPDWVSRSLNRKHFASSN